MAAPTDRLKAWQGALVIVIVGIGAQIAGGVAMGVAAGVEVATGALSLDDLASGDLPLSFGLLASSLVAIELTLVAGAVLATLLARVPVKEALGLKKAPWPTFLVAPIGILALGPTSDSVAAGHGDLLADLDLRRPGHARRRRPLRVDSG